MSIINSRIARVSTVPFFVFTQLNAQINTLKNTGAIVSVIASDDEDADRLRGVDGVEFLPVNINRKISIVGDLLALYKLIKIFKERRFDIVHSTTPKAGLLCAIAGIIAGVKVRLHTFTGQPWVTMSGFKKGVLKNCDKLIGCLNSRCYADSQSQRDFLIDSGIVNKSKIYVLGEGSLAGVDLKRFDLRRFSESDNALLKGELGVSSDSLLILFVGRVTVDKGVNELVRAFHQVLVGVHNAYLLFVGPYEADGQSILEGVTDSRVSSRIKMIGFSSEPEKYMAIADLLCIPSYREGFGTVVLEAAAMGVPTVGTNIYGLTDAVVNGETGLLVPVGDDVQLGQALISLLSDPALRAEMSIKARDRAVKSFDCNVLSQLLIKEYEYFLSAPHRN